MKRTKRLLALVLALMMAFSIMAVTAAAYGEEDAHVHSEVCGVERGVARHPEKDCPICFTPMIYMTDDGITYYLKCPKCGETL